MRVTMYTWLINPGWLVADESARDDRPCVELNLTTSRLEILRGERENLSLFFFTIFQMTFFLSLIKCFKKQNLFYDRACPFKPLVREIFLAESFFSIWVEFQVFIACLRAVNKCFANLLRKVKKEKCNFLSGLSLIFEH